MKNMPSYPITSVDNALRLSRLLLLEGSLSVSEAATAIGIARSTAHRILAMLTYHGFAEQGEDRRYQVGPVLRSGTSGTTSIDLLRQTSLPTLKGLVARVGETTTLQVLTGTKSRVIETVECERSLRIGSRTDRLLEAHLTSGGKALLALLDDEEIERRYASVTGIDADRVLEIVHRTRELGYGTSEQESEVGVSAIGMSIPGRTIETSAAVTIAIPTIRVSKKGLTTMLRPLREAVAEIVRSLPPQVR